MSVAVDAVPWHHPDAERLRAAMAAEITDLYADMMGGKAVPAALAVPADEIVTVGVARDADGTAVGHLALCRHGADVEIKRMFVLPAARGRGVGGALLAAAEDWAARLGAPRIVLQTGDRQPSAVRLYTKAGYRPIPVFPPYDALPFSLCFAKTVTTAADAGTTPHPC